MGVTVSIMPTAESTVPRASGYLRFHRSHRKNNYFPLTPFGKGIFSDNHIGICSETLSKILSEIPREARSGCQRKLEGGSLSKILSVLKR